MSQSQVYVYEYGECYYKLPSPLEIECIIIVSKTVGKSGFETWIEKHNIINFSSFWTYKSIYDLEIYQ